MEAVKFIKEWARMCKSAKSCSECIIGKNAGMFTICGNVIKEDPEKYVAIVKKKWSAEHPAKTRQSEFLKIYPDACIAKNGVIQICPNRIEKSKEFDCHVNCHDCQKEYWLAEVGDE